MKVAFLPINFDDIVCDEIESCKQTKKESVPIFISIMEALFKKLSKKPV